ncbi:MAG: Gfo/Idh/MocA family protein [Gemmatimonadota bacterium]
MATLVQRAALQVQPITSAPAIAVIGCGAIARSAHVPALARHSGVRKRAILVDSDRDRAQALAGEFGIATTAADYRDILPAVQGAVIAVPHHLHFPVALDCLRAGVHVLCEKPLAASATEGAQLVAAAKRARVGLAVNHIRRLFPPSQAVRYLLHQGAIGTVRFIGYYDGAKYDWPAASGFAFGVRSGGKGVLFDIGAHVLDLICWWLGRPPRVTDYIDDSCGGSEAVAKVSFADERETLRGEVHLSWLAKLQNGFRIEGDEGTITGSIFDFESLQVTSKSNGGRRKTVPITTRVRSLGDIAPLIMENFLAVIAGDEEPLVPGRDVVPSIGLIEECYARRRRFPMPWLDYAS